MSGSEEKKLNSLHEVDSLYKVQGGKAAYQISSAYGAKYCVQGKFGT